MSSWELSFESPPSLRVTWNIPHFFKLYKESDNSLQSPYFTFEDGGYCLRLFKKEEYPYGSIGIQLLNVSGTDPGRAVLYEAQLKSRFEEIDLDQERCDKSVFCLFLRELERQSDLYVPEDILTLHFSLRQRKQSSAQSLNSGGAQTQVIPTCKKIIGQLSFESPPFLYVTWRITAIVQQSYYSIKSPEFSFCGRRYCLRMISTRDDQFIYIRVVNLTDTVPGRYASYAIELNSTTGEDICTWRDGTSPTQEFFTARSLLNFSQFQRFPDGYMTMFCCMRSKEPSSAGSPNSGEAESQVFPSLKDPVPQAATLLKSVGVQTSNEEGDKEGLPGVEKLQSDYKRLLLNGVESDACLVVCGKEFRAHRNVLRVRSPVFEAMFGHETAEKESGRVVIDDLEPDCFQDFMEYLYTGRVESFSDDNVFGLYTAADKYDVPSLKSQCVEYMSRRLSVDNFCDVVTLALCHHEKDLLQLTVEFFKKNVASIILTVKWQQFMSENSTKANELFIKLHVSGK